MPAKVPQMLESLPPCIGEVKVLSRSAQAKPLPPLCDGGKPTPPSFYLRSDVQSLSLSAEVGILGDERAAPSHQIRERDILFADPALLREVANLPTNKSLKAGHAEKPCDIGQNVTLAEGDASVATWCVGDLIEIGVPGVSALVRITSTRRPCPKNNNVHGEGTWPHMDSHGLGGVFGTIVRGGTVHVGDRIFLVERLQSRWTCVRVHLALYGPSAKQTTAKELSEIMALEHLEEPRYKSIAKKRWKEFEPKAAAGRNWQFEAFTLLLVSVAAVHLFRRYSVSAR